MSITEECISTVRIKATMVYDFFKASEVVLSGFLVYNQHIKIFFVKVFSKVSERTQEQSDTKPSILPGYSSPRSYVHI